MVSHCYAVYDDGFNGTPVEINQQLLWEFCFLES